MNGEGTSGNTVIVGGDMDSEEPPPRTVGSYWPHAPAPRLIFIRRAMPADAPKSLTNEEVYQVTAYVLYLELRHCWMMFERGWPGRVLMGVVMPRMRMGVWMVRSGAVAYEHTGHPQLNNLKVSEDNVAKLWVPLPTTYPLVVLKTQVAKQTNRTKQIETTVDGYSQLCRLPCSSKPQKKLPAILQRSQGNHAAASHDTA